MTTVKDEKGSSPLMICLIINALFTNKNTNKKLPLPQINNIFNVLCTQLHFYYIVIITTPHCVTFLLHI